MRECRVGERERVSRSLDELHSSGESPARNRKHVGGLVEPDHGMTRRQKTLGDEPCAGRDIEHATAVSRDTLNEEATPARVLAERHQCAHPVIRRPEWLKQLERMLLARHARILAAVSLVEDLERIAGAVTVEGEALPVGVLPVEIADGERLYVVAFAKDESTRTWLVVDDRGAPVTDRRQVRDAVSIAALCEIAEEAAFPGDLDELRAQLVSLRLTEAPEGIDEAEAAARELQHIVAAPPQVASPKRLDEIGQAARRLERALDAATSSPFSGAMRSAQSVADELWHEVETTYRVPLT